jgi:hypothetical protein
VYEATDDWLGFFVLYGVLRKASGGTMGPATYNRCLIGSPLTGITAGQSWCRGYRCSDFVGLTWHNPNFLVLVKGPEIAIQPVGVRRLPSEVAQVKRHGGDV